MAGPPSANLVFPLTPTLTATTTPSPITPSHFECALTRSPRGGHSRSSSGSSLCDSQQRLHDILELFSGADAIRPTADSKTGPPPERVHSTSYVPPPYSAHAPPSGTPTLTLPPLAAPPAYTPTETMVRVHGPPPSAPRGRTMRRRDQSSEVQERTDSREFEHVRSMGGGSLGLSTSTNEPAYTQPDPPPSRFSDRLRRLAPAPLSLVPLVAHYATLPAAPGSSQPDSGRRAHTGASASLRATRATPLLLKPLGHDDPADMLDTPISLEDVRAVGDLSPADAWLAHGHAVRAADGSPHRGVLPGATHALGASIFVRELPPTYRPDISPRDAEPDEGMQIDEVPRTPADAQPYSAASSARHAGPPPHRRAAWVPLPAVLHEEPLAYEHVLLSPLVLDLHQSLAIDEFMVRADRCAEAVGQACLSLCSSSWLREPIQIAEVCRSLQSDFEAIQRAIDATPAELAIEDQEAREYWWHKRRQMVESLDRNMHMFYLFVDGIRQRPPRIHRLGSHIDKLHAYHQKFSDLERRLSLSNEKYRILEVRTRFMQEQRAARVLASQERVHRHDFRQLWDAARARRRELREQIRHLRGLAQASSRATYGSLPP